MALRATYFLSVIYGDPVDVDVCNIGFAFISSETQSVPLRLVTSKV